MPSAVPEAVVLLAWSLRVLAWQLALAEIHAEPWQMTGSGFGCLGCRILELGRLGL